MMKKVVKAFLIGCVMGAFCTLPVQAAEATEVSAINAQSVIESIPILSDIISIIETVGNKGPDEPAAPPTPIPSMPKQEVVAPPSPDKLILSYGQEVWLGDGTLYYESADQAGSGKHGTANNIYTESLKINGFATLNEHDGIADAECFTPINVPVGTAAPEFFEGRRNYTEWVCLYSEERSSIVGWVPNAVVRTQAPTQDDTGDTGSESNHNDGIDEAFGGNGIYYYRPEEEPPKAPPVEKAALKCDPANMYVGTVGGGANIDDIPTPPQPSENIIQDLGGWRKCLKDFIKKHF